MAAAVPCAHYLLEIRSALLIYRQLVTMLAGSGADLGQ